MGKDFKIEDQFRVNMTYYSNLIKIKIPVMHSKAQKIMEE